MAFCISGSLDHDAVKATVWSAYQLVPEAYRQLWTREKPTHQAYVEFAPEKSVLFEKCCGQSGD